MEKEITSQEYRQQFREKGKAFSDFIDGHYFSLFEIAKYAKENKLIPTRIETPYGDFVIQSHIVLPE